MLALVPLLQAALAARDRLRNKFAGFWKANELDLLLCPVFPFPPPPVEEVRKGSGRYIHTRIYNFLDYAAGVVPATRVTEEDLLQGYDAKTDDVPLAEMATLAVEGSLGLPVAVQLAPWPGFRFLPWVERKCRSVRNKMCGTVVQFGA